MVAAAVVEVFTPGDNTGVDLVAGDEGAPVVVLGCEGGSQGFDHGVIPAHLGLHHRHGSLGGEDVGGQLLGGELCFSISVEHDPTGKAPRVVAISRAVMTGSVFCWSPVAYPRTLRECAPRTGRSSFARIAGRRIVRDSHVVKGCLGPTRGRSGRHGPQVPARRACCDAGAHVTLSCLGGASTGRPPAHPHPRPHALEYG